MLSNVTNMLDDRERAGLTQWLHCNWSDQPETFDVDVEGARIACRGWNLGAKHLPLIMLVHGFRAHARWWDHIAPALTARHRVVAINMSGMGDSGWRPHYARSQLGREALTVAESLGEMRPIVIAHSFGGVCVALAARTFPDRMQRLIIIDSAFPAPDEQGREIEDRPERFYSDAETAVARFRLVPPGEWPNPLVLDYIARHSVIKTDDGWTWKFDPSSAEPLNTDRYYGDLFGITVPVDVIYGELTEIMTPPRRAALREMAMNVGQEIFIPACHHHVLIEQPIALVAALNALLANPR